MDNLPKIQDELNIFQKLRIRFYLMRKYSSSRFISAPEYIKQDERVLRKMIKGEQSISDSKNEDLIELFKSRPSLFDKESKNKVVKYALDHYKYDIVSELTDDEQYNIIADAEEKHKYFSEKMWPYIRLEVVQRIISEERCDTSVTNWSYKPLFLQHCNLSVQLEIISQNKDFLQFASDDTKVTYLIQHEEDIELVDDNTKKQFFHENISFLDGHLEYVRVADRETQLAFASQDKIHLKYINKGLQIEVLKGHPEAFKYIEDVLKKELFTTGNIIYDNGIKENLFYIITKLLDNDLKYFKFVGFDKSRNIAEEYLKFFRTKVNSLDIKTIKEYFINSGLLGAMGNLRTRSSSYFKGLDSDREDVRRTRYI